jgi:hypothetical protein
VGYSYITVHEPYMRAFAAVIERLRAGQYQRAG